MPDEPLIADDPHRVEHRERHGAQQDRNRVASRLDHVTVELTRLDTRCVARAPSAFPASTSGSSARPVGPVTIVASVPIADDIHADVRQRTAASSLTAISTSARRCAGADRVDSALALCARHLIDAATRSHRAKGLLVVEPRARARRSRSRVDDAHDERQVARHAADPPIPASFGQRAERVLAVRQRVSSPPWVTPSSVRLPGDRHRRAAQRSPRVRLRTRPYTMPSPLRTESRGHAARQHVARGTEVQACRHARSLGASHLVLDRRHAERIHERHRHARRDSGHRAPGESSNDARRRRPGAA